MVDGVDHIFNFGFGQHWVDGQGQRLCRGLLGMGKLPRLVAKIGKALLQMQRQGIINFRTHTVIRQVLFQTVTILAANDELVVYVPVHDLYRQRQSSFLQAGRLEKASVDPRVFLSGRRPGVEMTELGQHHCGLDSIETKIAADELVKIFGLGTVVAQNLQPFRPIRILADNKAAVPGPAEILGRKEGERPVVADGASTVSLVFGADGLGCILDHGDWFLVEGVSEVHDGVHVGHLAE